MGFARFVWLGLSLVGCAGSVTGSGTNGSSNGSSSLTGTWDVIGSDRFGGSESVVVKLSSSVLSIDARGDVITAAATGNAFDVTADIGRGLQHFVAERTPVAGALGVIPLPLFGDWVAQRVPFPGCTISAHPDAVSATCTYVDGPAAWAPRLNGHLDAVKTRVLASEYGDFGGEWSVTTATGATCTIRFEGTTISTHCQNAGHATGTATLSMDGDTGHGSTSSGIEFTAQRR